MKEKIGEDCEIEGYVDLANEDKPRFKVKFKGKGCQKILGDSKLSPMDMGGF